MTAKDELSGWLTLYYLSRLRGWATLDGREHAESTLLATDDLVQLLTENSHLLKHLALSGEDLAQLSCAVALVELVHLVLFELWVVFPVTVNSLY